MKVKLTGISTSDSVSQWESYKELFEQVPYPLIVEAENYYPNIINLKQFINDPNHLESLEEWGLEWFTYEEIKD